MNVDPLTPFYPPQRVRFYTPDDIDNPMRRFVADGQPLPHALAIGDDPDDGEIAYAGTREELASFADRLVAAVGARDDGPAICGSPVTKRIERVGNRPGTVGTSVRLGTDYACDQHAPVVAASRRAVGEEATVWPYDGEVRRCRSGVSR